MSEMTERVALAISGGNDPADILEIHRQRARLAISAMEHPTAEMCRAACRKADQEQVRPIPIRITDAEIIWQAMIDEALK